MYGAFPARAVSGQCGEVLLDGAIQMEMSWKGGGTEMIVCGDALKIS